MERQNTRIENKSIIVFSLNFISGRYHGTGCAKLQASYAICLQT